MKYKIHGFNSGSVPEKYWSSPRSYKFCPFSSKSSMIFSFAFNSTNCLELLFLTMSIISIGQFGRHPSHTELSQHMTAYTKLLSGSGFTAQHHADSKSCFLVGASGFLLSMKTDNFTEILNCLPFLSSSYYRTF